MSRRHKKPKKPIEAPSPAVAPALPPAGRPSRWAIPAAFALLVVLVFLTYSNHFHNSFHFDDSHAIVGNPYIRDLHNASFIFRDARTDDTLPANQTYRPLVTLSFAVDYRLGHGLNPLWFQSSTFLWYLLQLGLMYLLFRRVFDAAGPGPGNAWVALFATAVFGLHPAMAETVNYIWQRAEVYSTVAVLGGLLIYISAPGLRRYGVYLIPVLAGLLAKQTTAVFPALLFAWIWLFEERSFWKALGRCIPAFIVTGAGALFVLRMNAATYFGGAPSAYNYRISQPAVVLSYFRRFFLPFDLSADTDRRPYTSVLDIHVVLGSLFVLLMVAAALWCMRRRETRPIAFGFFWFLVACAPTSWVPLAEVENDHRLFFPFVGLALGVCWAAAIWLQGLRLPRAAIAGACALVLACAAWGAHQRNEVWRTDESLWLDVTRKSPRNGRGLMNYGGSQMALGRYPVALDYFTRALVYNPYYPTLEINLGVVNGALHNTAESEKHFLRAIRLAPKAAEGRWFYARWLNSVGRVPEAIARLGEAIRLQPDYIDARYLLMQIYAKLGDRQNLSAQASATLAVFPGDALARAWLAKAPTLLPASAQPVASAAGPADTGMPAENLLNQSLAFYQAGLYYESITAARKALEIRPRYPEAWNNIMAAYNSLDDWDDAIAAGEMAVTLDPSSQLARNNLALAKAQKAKSAAQHR
jgi:tetratricopeptide (TPR) repeat protein